MEKIRNKEGRVRSYREKVYVDGKSVTKTFKRKADALKWKNSYSMEVERRKLLGIDDIESIDFESYFPIWLEMKLSQGKARRTMDDYKSVIRNYLHPCIGKKRLEKINQTVAQEIIRKARKRGLSNARQSSVLIVLKQMLGDAIEFNYLTRNPLERVKLIKRLPRSLTYWLPDEIHQFLSKNIDNPFYPIFVIALNTGMRKGELMGLCWDRVNLKERKIEISRMRDLYGLKETTKTKEIRFIPLNKEAYRTLVELANKKNHDRFVFALEGGTLPDAQHFTERYFKKAVAKAKVRRIRFHDLRTSYASNFVMSGGDIFTLSRLLGHTSVEMTATKYAALHPSYMSGIADTVLFTGRVLEKMNCNSSL